MGLRAVTYSSFASAGLQPGDIEAILRVSARSNARDAITGVLMFNGAMFVQTIEGDEEGVERLLARLHADRRHCEIAIRDDRRLARRIFPDWTMGYVRLDGGWLEGQHEILDALSREMPDAVRDILTELATTLPFA